MRGLVLVLLFVVVYFGVDDRVAMFSNKLIQNLRGL